MMTHIEFEERLINSLPTHPDFYWISVSTIKELFLDLIGENESEKGEFGTYKYVRDNFRYELKKIVTGGKE